MITEKLSENYAREFISRTESILSQYNEIVATKLEAEHRESEFYDVSLFINCLYGLLMMPSKLNKSVLEKFVLRARQSLKTRKSAKCQGFIVLTALRFCTWYKHISGTKQLVPDFFLRLRILLGCAHCRFAWKNRSGEKPTLAGCCSKA